MSGRHVIVRVQHVADWPYLATCVAAAPDGMTAAASSNDGSVVVWDLA